LDAARDELRDERDVVLELGARRRVGGRGRAVGGRRVLLAAAAGGDDGEEHEDDGGSRHAWQPMPGPAIMARARRPIPPPLLLVAAGCSSGSKHDAQPAAGPAVPWTAATPPELAERAPVARACRAADLEVRGQVKFVPRLEGGIALPTIRNTGKH